MHYASRLRLIQISEQLKRSEGAVKLLLYRARQALKRCLDGGAAQASEEHTK
jgi:RNA polymerase sigma-70 factor (ECF subfamily)